jgi:hypothetical protein
LLRDFIFKKKGNGMFILKKLGVILILTNLLYNAALEIPNYLDKNDILNAEFKCLSKPVKYNKKDQKYVDILWDETLVYLKAYALALTNGDLNHCMNSDEAIYDTTKKDQKMCIMDRRDMKNMVKNIYQILFIIQVENFKKNLL